MPGQGVTSTAPIQCSAVQSFTVHYRSTVQCSTVLSNTVKYNAVQYREVHYSTMQYSAVQGVKCGRIRSNALQYISREIALFGARSMNWRV